MFSLYFRTGTSEFGTFLSQIRTFFLRGRKKIARDWYFGDFFSRRNKRNCLRSRRNFCFFGMLLDLPE